VLKRELPFSEVSRWLRVWERFPFDLESLHHRPMAHLACLYANANKGKDSAPVTVRDMMPYGRFAADAERTEEEEEQDLEHRLLHTAW
jgi:hypothetical protein